MTVAGFLYFIDDVADDGRPLRLLESITIGAELVAEDVLRGPSGGPGFLIACRPTSPAGRLPAMRYAPDWQQWAAVAGGLWIGYEIEHRPRPVDVQRTERLQGHPVRLSDGNDWTVPVLCTAEGHLHVLAGSPLGLLADKLFVGLIESIMAGRQPDVNGGEVLAAAVLALGRNYRVDLSEWKAIGIGEHEDVGNIIHAAIGVPALIVAVADAAGEQITVTI